MGGLSSPSRFLISFLDLFTPLTRNTPSPTLACSSFSLFFRFCFPFSLATLQYRKFPLIVNTQPFFTLILSAGNPKLASTFIPKAAPSLEPGETIAMYEKCGMRVKAAEVRLSCLPFLLPINHLLQSSDLYRPSSLFLASLFPVSGL